MNYNNPFMNPYGYGQMQQPIYQQPQRQVEKLNGRNGAMQLPMGPNSSGWYLDQSGTMAWLITTDSAGYKTVTAYDISLHQDAQDPNYETLENRVKRLEEIVDERNTAGSSAAWEKQHAANGSACKTDDEYGPYGAGPAGGPQPARSEQPANETGNGHRAAVWRRSNEGAARNSGADGFQQ